MSKNVADMKIEDVLDQVDAGAITPEFALEQEGAAGNPRVTLLRELERRLRANAPTGPWRIVKGFNVPSPDDPFGMGERFEPGPGSYTAADLPGNTDTAWLLEAGCLEPIENGG